MKSFLLFVFCICFAQSCQGAPADDGSSNPSEGYFSDVDIRKLSSDLKNMPGLNSKSVDDFAKILKKFGQNSTEDEMIDGVLELLSMAVQGSTCDSRRIDLSQIFQSIRNEETSAKASGKSSHYMTQDELTIINAELSKLLNQQQTKHAMRILRGFRENAAENEKDVALLDLFRSAILSLQTACTAN